MFEIRKQTTHVRNKKLQDAKNGQIISEENTKRMSELRKSLEVGESDYFDPHTTKVSGRGK